MKRALLVITLLCVTYITGYFLGLIYEPFSYLFMYWAGMLYIGLWRIKTPEYKINPMLRSSIPQSCYVLLTPHDTMVVSPDPDDIKQSIDMAKG